MQSSGVRTLVLCVLYPSVALLWSVGQHLLTLLRTLTLREGREIFTDLAANWHAYEPQDLLQTKRMLLEDARH